MKTIYRKTKKQWRLNARGVLKEIFGLFMIKIQTYGHGHRVPCGTLLKRLFTYSILIHIFHSLTPEINRYTSDVSRLDIEVSSGSRPSDKGRGVGHPDPEIKGGPASKKKFFRPFGPHFRLKIRGRRAPRASPLDPPLEVL